MIGKNTSYVDLGDGKYVACKEGQSLFCPHGTTVYLLRDRETGEMMLPIRIVREEEECVYSPHTPAGSPPAETPR